MARSCPRFRRPTLLVSAEDDPIVPAHSIPRPTIDANPALTLWLTPGGGHVGFVAGSPWRPVYVAEDATMEYLARHLAAAAG